MSSQASTAWLQLWNWTSLPSQEIAERVLKGYQGLLFTPICPGEKRGRVAGDKPGDCQWRSFSCACGCSLHRVPPSFHYYLEQSLLIAWTAVYEHSEDRKALNQQGSSQSYGLIAMRSSWALMFNSYPIKRSEGMDASLCHYQRDFCSTAKLKPSPSWSCQNAPVALSSCFKERVLAHNSFWTCVVLFSVFNIFRVHA